MRMNEHTIICGDKVILVPYRREHVETYHQWMKSPELLETTASEPLTFEEELDMQRKWQEDDDKLTFIILARPEDIPVDSHRLLTSEDVARCPMIGDVNLFIPEGQEDAECEIMLAETAYRGRGMAAEALRLFLTYVVHSARAIPATNFIARIGAQNSSSLRLFEQLGFGKVRLVEVWDEVEMRWGWNASSGAVASPEDTARAWPDTLLAGRVGVYQ